MVNKVLATRSFSPDRTSQICSPRLSTNGFPIGHTVCTVRMSAPMLILSSFDNPRNHSRTGSLPASVLKNTTLMGCRGCAAMCIKNDTLSSRVYVPRACSKTVRRMTAAAFFSECDLIFIGNLSRQLPWSGHLHIAPQALSSRIMRTAVEAGLTALRRSRPMNR